MNTTLDYLIIGAGPAGLQLGYFLEKAGYDYLILERGEPGEFYRRFPRHRTLISSNKVHTGYSDPERNMRYDWNSLLTDEYAPLFKDYTQKYFAPADDLVRYLMGFAKRHNLKVRSRSEVKRVSRPSGGDFQVETADGQTFSTRRLVAATGYTRRYVPSIPGIELAESYTDVSVDPDDFKNQRVLIIGKGNSAFETGDNLVETAAIIHLASPHPLKLAWSSHYAGHLRAVNNNLLDTYQLKTQNAILDASIQGIERTPKGRLRVRFAYTHAHGEVEDLEYDRVILCTGFAFDASVFSEECRPALTINDRFPAQTCEWESTNVKDLYIAGTLSQVRDFKKTNSAFIHGFRYNVRALARILERKYHGKPIPSHAVDPTPEGYTQAVLARLNGGSGLWQQFGFLGDVLVPSEDGGRARLHEELPVDYIHQSEFARSDYFVITQEFGKHQPGQDPLAIERNPLPDMADKSFFLHPVIRHYCQGTLVAEQHLLENLFGEWESEEIHVRPLRAFFEARFAALQQKARSLAG